MFKKLLLVLVLLLPNMSYAEDSDKLPTSFNSVKEMIEAFSDYNEEKGTFKSLKEKPIHIQLSPTVYPAENQDVIKGEVQRTLIYGIYRPFIFTKIDKITVTVIPKEFKSDKYLSSYKVTISKSRNDALSLVKKHLHVSSFQELVTPQKIGDFINPYSFSDKFDAIYHGASESVVSRKAFVDELLKK